MPEHELEGPTGGVPGRQTGGRGDKVGQGYRFSSVGSRFKRQLGELMEALHRMEPHYIRCIKPNSFNRRARARAPARTAQAVGVGRSLLGTHRLMRSVRVDAAQTGRQRAGGRTHEVYLP